MYMSHLMYYCKYCSFFLAKEISRYRDENTHNSSHIKKIIRKHTMGYFKISWCEIHFEIQWTHNVMFRISWGGASYLSWWVASFISWWGESSYMSVMILCKCRVDRPFPVTWLSNVWEPTFVSFDSFAFYCSLFNRKKFNSDPGLYSRYFDPVQPVVREVLYKNAIYHLCKSINIIQQTAPTLS